MKKAKSLRSKREPMRVRTLYLGQWLSVLDVKPVEVSRGIGCSEAYLSNLIKGTVKKNPSTEFMLDLSDFLGLNVNDLFDPPPPKSETEQLGKLTKSQWAAFLEVRAMMTRKKT
jgi:transcriptional regulator with XRE-family HTH domain